MNDQDCSRKKMKSPNKTSETDTTFFVSSNRPIRSFHITNYSQTDTHININTKELTTDVNKLSRGSLSLFRLFLPLSINYLMP